MATLYYTLYKQVLINYQILTVHNFCGHIYQLNSFTPPGTGPTGNIIAPSNKGFEMPNIHKTQHE